MNGWRVLARFRNLLDYSYARYWDTRYRNPKQGAGPGSLGPEAAFFREEIVHRLRRRGCKSLLDIGCGATQFWIDGLPVDDYTGLDVSERAIDHASRLHPTSEFFCGDISQLCWFGRTFDAVLCSEVLMHIKPEDYQMALNNVFCNAEKLVLIKSNPDSKCGGYQFAHGPPTYGDWPLVDVVKRGPLYLWEFIPDGHRRKITGRGPIENTG